MPVGLVYPAAACEICAGTLLIFGLWIRPVAFLLAGWCLLTAAIFHTAFSDPTQLTMCLKNMTMAGGFLMFSKSASWNTSLDALFAAKSAGS